MSPVNLTAEAFAGIELIAVVAFLAPLLLDLLRLRFLPAVVLEIGAGMIIGPYGLGWVRGDDVPIQIFALITAGLASVIIFPALAQVLLRPLAEPTTDDTSTPTSHPFSGLPRLGTLALRPWRGRATPDPST